MTTAPNILSSLGLSLMQAFAIAPATVYLAVWAFAFGAVLGSFLNVVIWRMPLGRSVVAPRSSCPNCRSAIRGYDNIPVLSWLLLRGKCRACKTSISARYPIVELCVGLLVMLLACAEGMNYGFNLPIELQLLFDSIWSGWAAMGLHAVVLLTLFCQTMILFDGKIVPRRLFAMAITAAIIVPVIFAGVRPLAVSTAIIANPLLAQLATTVAGTAVGIIIGWLCLPATFNEQQDRLSTVWAFGVCGLAFGWQAVVAIGLLSSIGYFATKVYLLATRFRQRLPRAVTTLLAAIGYVFCWGEISVAWPQIGLYMNSMTLCGAMLGVAVISLATSWLPTSQTKSTALHAVHPSGQRSPSKPENETVAV